MGPLPRRALEGGGGSAPGTLERTSVHPSSQQICVEQLRCARRCTGGETALTELTVKRNRQYSKNPDACTITGVINVRQKRFTVLGGCIMGVLGFM